MEESINSAKDNKFLDQDGRPKLVINKDNGSTIKHICSKYAEYEVNYYEISDPLEEHLKLKYAELGLLIQVQGGNFEPATQTRKDYSINVYSSDNIDINRAQFVCIYSEVNSTLGTQTLQKIEAACAAHLAKLYKQKSI